MQTIENDTKIEYEHYTNKYKLINFEKTLFFDIETTGFSAKNTKVYMIGILFCDKISKTFRTIQWFSDNPDDEILLLTSFVQFSSNYDTLIHYNGKGFDIPYMEAKFTKHNVEFSFDRFLHIDLYKYATQLKNIFKTPNLKQKTMEEFFDLNRNDIFGGGDLISVYYDYLNTHDERGLNFLTLHNFEDLKGMLTLLNILDYSGILSGDYEFISFTVTSATASDDLSRKEVIIELKLNSTIPKRVSFGNKDFYMTAFDNKLKIKIDVYSEELKFFYSNYKDYYYLPEEDMAIHKSVAFYVDKNFRTRAKAANCYSKKTGQFLPQYSEIVTPYFKKEWNDKITYFEILDEFIDNYDLIYRYSKHIIDYLLKIK